MPGNLTQWSRHIRDSDMDTAISDTDMLIKSKLKTFGEDSPVYETRALKIYGHGLLAEVMLTRGYIDNDDNKNELVIVKTYTDYLSLFLQFKGVETYLIGQNSSGSESACELAEICDVLIRKLQPEIDKIKEKAIKSMALDILTERYFTSGREKELPN
jgi:hypothetical protein